MAKKPPQVKEDTWFEEDPEDFTTAGEKNDFLADLLANQWHDLEIVSIRRLEIAVRGWEATYRKSGR